MRSATGDHKQQAFDELRALLVVHESAEEIVLRPVSRDVAGAAVADERTHEEEEATKVLKALEGMDIASAAFDSRLAALEQAVSDHAESEENDEFPHVLAQCDADRRASMGTRLKAVESMAPTHPHASTAGQPAAARCSWARSSAWSTGCATR